MKEEKYLSDNIFGYLPVIGDVLSAGDVALDLKRGNYLKAIAGAGLLFVPNIVEKPVKAVGKALIKHGDDVAALAKGIHKKSKQMSNLSKYVKRTSFDVPEESLKYLEEFGLTKMDLSRLFERGWDLDQIFEALGRHGKTLIGKPNSNFRANMFNAEMRSLGLKPNSATRRSFLEGIIDSGQKIYKDKYGTPYTLEEWTRKYPGIKPVSTMSKSDLIEYYAD